MWASIVMIILNCNTWMKTELTKNKLCKMGIVKKAELPLFVNIEKQYNKPTLKNYLQILKGFISHPLDSSSEY